jgi:hypothetical protein
MRQARKRGPVHVAIELKALAAAYQITKRSFSARAIGSSALHAKACAKDGMFEGTAVARRLPGACVPGAR